MKKELRKILIASALFFMVSTGWYIASDYLTSNFVYFFMVGAYLAAFYKDLY